MIPSTRKVNHIRSEAGARDEYGNRTEVFTAVAEYRANLFVTTRREIIDGLVTEIKEHRCLLPAAAEGTVEHGDVIEDEDGNQLRVQNVVTRRDWTGRVHHITVDLEQAP